MNSEDVARIFESLDAIRGDVREIKAACGPCKDTVRENHRAIHGNGRDGLKTEVAVLSGNVERLLRRQWSPKQIIAVIAAITTLATAVGVGTGQVAAPSPLPAVERQGEP